MHTLNARNLLCPMPVIRLQDACKKLTRGEQVVVIGTDPGIQYDIPAWCRVHGHRVLSVDAKDSEIEIVIEIGGKHGQD